MIRKKEAIKFKIQQFNSKEESAPLHSTESEEKNQLKRQLHDILTQEKIIWKQRSHVSWLKHGDQNMKCFHIMAMARTRKNSITYLEH